MTFAQATREAALAAQKAVTNATERVRLGRLIDEDDLTGILVGQLDAALKGNIGGLEWDCSILRHRGGVAAEEKRFGADLLLHVKMNTSTQNLFKRLACSGEESRARSQHVHQRACRFSPSMRKNARNHTRGVRLRLWKWKRSLRACIADRGCD
jgi:hypothetical protein